jgi:MEMO1 family protein
MMRLFHGALLLCLLIAQHTWARNCHYSSSSDDPKPYLRAIEKSSRTASPELPAGQSIRAGIVTHHFLASGLMVRFFDALHSQSSPQVIVLIGPNHFHHGLANISLSSLRWKTPFGYLETDRHVIQRLKSAIDLPEDPEAFTGEHSVGVLIPFLRYYFPHSRVVPILVDINAQATRLKELRIVLAELLRDPKVLVLLSMDFSHDSVARIADSRDEQAQQTISAMDVRGVNELHVDCRRGLWLLLASLSDLGRVRVQINEHTNSAHVTGNLEQPDVTSYFTMFFLLGATT